MRLVYSYLVLALFGACGGESVHQDPGTTDEPASDTSTSTTGAAEPTSTTSAASVATESAEPPNNAEESTTGDSSTTVFTATEALDTSSTTQFSGDTDDTVGPGETESAGDTDPSETETGTGGDPQPCVGGASPVDAQMIAYLDSQIGNPGGEPELLHVRFSSQSFTCADPHDELACGHNWEVSLQIPAEFQVPGVYALADGQVYANGHATGGGGDDVCEEGDGAVTGTLEIDAVEDGAVTGRLCHLRAFLLEGPIELDGTFVAPRCPQ
ncbi:hypothetical protein [Nannocystis radixulma]|uniref:Lipoprotein n=1 Tax=Nannocystis radixulma TaxID=2995305 RepID=A0ABT5BFP1_9BACT|nr:hypothetical protein [Nannocystis radixulma]MDC0672430.1 hypothetical protein [Nannocystis radixulma]